MKGKDVKWPDLDEAKAEAKRFLKRVRELEEREAPYYHAFGAWPERAAVKRASMDLTRALAKIRRAR